MGDRNVIENRGSAFREGEAIGGRLQEMKGTILRESKEMMYTLEFLRKRPFHAKIVPPIPHPSHRKLVNAGIQAGDPIVPSSIDDAHDGAQTSKVEGDAQLPLSRRELGDVFSALDEDGDGLVSHSQFIEKLKREKSLARRMGLGSSSKRVAEEAARLWDCKYGRQVVSGRDVPFPLPPQMVTCNAWPMRRPTC